MRIVFVADDIDAVGGIQSVTHTLAQHLAGRGHQVHAVGLYRNTTPAALPDRPTYHRTVLDAPPPNALLDACGLRASKQRMAALLTEPRSGVLIMSSVHVSLWMQDVDTSGYLRIGHYHGSYEYARTHYHLHVIADLWTTFDLSVFLSAADATAFATHNALQATWIPNPIPASAPPERFALPLAAAGRVVAVGRLAAIKRFDLAITAFVDAAVPGWNLHIIGDGDQQQTLRRIAAQRLPRSPVNAGTPLVVFRGRLPSAAMPAEYAAAQLLLLTSEHEGFGMVIAEAAAAGTPAVAFDVSGGVRSLVHHDRTGLLVPSGDVVGLASALRALMTDPARRHRLGQAARAVAGALNPEIVTTRWEQLLFALASRDRQEVNS
jgi:glycosyltransferase involved in cell wall biosynthesis